MPLMPKLAVFTTMSITLSFGNIAYIIPFISIDYNDYLAVFAIIIRSFAQCLESHCGKSTN